jgi:hypothetical protein
MFQGRGRQAAKVWLAGALMACVAWALSPLPCHAAQTVYPSADGTLADGFAGPFDGVADHCDWTFNETNYEGAITLVSGIRENRVVWEYNLASVTLAPPVSATLTVTMRGAPVFPPQDADVHVYSYPADLVEACNASDFSAGPTVLQGVATVSREQPPTVYTIDVSAVVSQALSSGGDKVAFRFQIDPNTPYDTNQAFIDALDADPSTKPYLTIDEFAPSPGDFDGDGDVDLDDFAVFGQCFGGADNPPAAGCPSGVDADLDGDGDVDLNDFAIFGQNFTGAL